jgi:hypothetical protein
MPCKAEKGRKGLSEERPQDVAVTVQNVKGKMALEILSRQLTAYAMALSARPARLKGRFIIFAQGRTGSTLLQNLLNKHPDIFCDREIFSLAFAGRVLFRSLFIDGRSKEAALHNKTFYGCKMGVYQLSAEQKIGSYETFLCGLYKKGWMFIHLKRLNIVKQCISADIAGMRGTYYSKTPADVDKIKVDCSRFLELLKRREEYLAREEKVLENIGHLSLVYEDDLLNESDHQKTVDKVCAYIGAAQYPVKTDLVKTLSDSIADNVNNYDELCRCLENTKYAAYLK